MIELGSKIGYRVHYYKQETNGSVIGGRMVRSSCGTVVTFIKRKKWMYKPTDEHYCGKIWCIDVDNHNFLVERNGFIDFCGNTPEVYGNIPNSFSESKVYNPTTPYAASKASFDMYLDVVNRQYGFPSIIFRSANIYGAHQQLFRIIPKTLICIRNQAKLNLDGGGETRRYFIHTNDLSDGIVKLVNNGRLGNIYHFGGGEYISIKELVYKICSIVNYDFDRLVYFSPDRRGKDIDYNLNFAKSTNELNWSTKIDLTSGILSTDGWISDNWQEIENYAVRTSNSNITTRNINN
jgi:dTDP-D-glucose 4,6-dehydratase